MKSSENKIDIHIVHCHDGSKHSCKGYAGVEDFLAKYRPLLVKQAEEVGSDTLIDHVDIKMMTEKEYYAIPCTNELDHLIVEGT